jgi:hypothetical protein
MAVITPPDEFDAEGDGAQDGSLRLPAEDAGHTVAPWSRIAAACEGNVKNA